MAQVENELHDDGRNIDQGLGTLSGEAAGQRRLSTKHDVALHAQAFPYVPSHQSTSSPSYYGHPMLKQPTWIWSIPTYFYVGGVAGVSGAFAAAAQVVGPDSMRSLITHGRWIATIGGAISAGLLIHDLGRPERFLYMLRVFRPTSPMSMGSWILTIFRLAWAALLSCRWAHASSARSPVRSDCSVTRWASVCRAIQAS